MGQKQNKQNKQNNQIYKNAAQNANALGYFPNNHGVNNSNMNSNPIFMNQNMMMGNQAMMMMNNPNAMMGNQNMMMSNPNNMVGNQNMMMYNPNCFNNQNMNMGNNNEMNNNDYNSNNQDNENINNDNDEPDEILRNLKIKEDDNKDSLNILFCLNTGPKVNVYGNENMTFKQILKLLCQKIFLEEKYLEDRIKFIKDYALFNPNSNSTLKDLRFGKKTIINVYDDKNVIGT